MCAATGFIRSIVLSTGAVTTLAGHTPSVTEGPLVDDIGTNSVFFGPASCAVSANGTYMIISDVLNGVFRKYTFATAATSTLMSSYNLM